MADSTQEQPKRRRGPGRPFPKGTSGNPGGRPKGVAFVREQAQAESGNCITRLVALRDQADNLSVARAAACDLLDRAVGKPPQSITGEGGEGSIVVQILKYSEEK